MDSSTPNDLVFARSAMVVRHLDADTLELTNLAGGWSCTATGRLRRAVEAALCGATVDPVLAALGADHPLVRAVNLVDGDTGRPLSLRQATELDGYDTLFIELTGACNERCVHCYAGSHPRVTAQLDQQTCCEVLEDAAMLGFQRVQFTGGDPLLCAFLPELVQTARDQGIATCEIFTNGLALDSQLLDRLAPLRPALALSFYSVDPHCHDAITRTPGSQQRTVRAIRKVIEAGLPVRVAIIAMEHNAHTVAETTAYLQGLGVDHVNVTAMRPVGRGDLYEGPLATAATPEVSHETAPSGTARQRLGKLCVTYESQVVPCIFNREDVLGDLRQRRLRDIAKDPRAPVGDDASTDQLIHACHGRLQCAGCRLTAYALRAASGSVGP